MTDRTYTDEQIISALEIRMPHDAICREAYDLIMRQRAEAEQLKHKYELAVAEREANVKGFTETLKTIKIEAIKEFAERLHKGINDFRDKREMVMLPYTESALLLIERKIDNLVEEMTEGKR